MNATLARLCEIRSRQSEALLSYLRTLEQGLAKNPLLERFGRRLDDLRVPLRVVPHEPIRDIEEVRAREHFRQTGSYDEGRARAENEQDNGPRRLYAFRGTGRDDDKMERAKPEPLAQLEPKLQMAVVLGDPGSGKSEWLKFRARQAAREGRTKLETCVVGVDEGCLPVYVRLREVAASLGSAEALLKFLVQIGCVAAQRPPLSNAERAAAALVKTLIEHYNLPARLASLVWQRLLPSQSPIRYRQSAASPALLCLDAWDEVRAPDDKLSELADCLKALAQVTPCRVFLTSRIIGYNHRPLPVENKADGPGRELRLCPFEWGETLQFAQSFFRADPERGSKMLTELRAKPNVAGMAQNPLLATLLCMAFAPNPHRPPLGFPARRVEAYKRVLEGLLGEWEAIDKGVTPDRELIQAKLRLLEELAHRFYPDEELSDERMHEFLWNSRTGYLGKLEASHPLKQRLRQVPGSSLVSDLCRDGVLVPVTGGSLMFLHLTFQEYLTACALGRRANNSGWRAISDLVSRKSWHPAWEEVLVMLAGKLKDAQTLQAMLEVLSIPPDEVSNPSRNDVFYHRVALAVRCLPEIAEPKRLTIRKLVSEIGTRAFGVWWAPRFGRRDSMRVLQRALPALGLANPEISILGQCRACPAPFLDQLAVLLATPNNDVRKAAAEAVQYIGQAAGTEKILDQLAELLANPDKDMRSAAAKTIGGIGAAAATEKFLDQLAGLLASYRGRWGVAETIQSIGAAAGAKKFLDQLAGLLATPNSDVREAAAKAVQYIGQAAGTEKILDQLARLLASPSYDARKAAAKAVGGIGTAAGTGKILDQLGRLLASLDKDAPRTVAYAIRGIGATADIEKILDQLAGLLANPDKDMRRAAAEAVESIGAAAGTEKFLDQLAGLLSSPSKDMCQSAAYAIGGIGATAATEKVVDQLAVLLGNPSNDVRRSAAWAVKGIGAAAGTERILNQLAVLLASPNEHVRRAVAYAIGGIGAAAGTEKILDQLAGLLANPSNDVCRAAAWVVSDIGAAAGTEKMLHQLAGLLSSPSNDVCQSATYAIRGIGATAGTEKILDQLGRLLANPDKDMCRAAAEAVGRVGAAAGTERILNQLAGLLANPSNDVREAAAMAVGSIGAAAGTEKILHQLAELLVSGYGRVRQAAAEAVGRIGAAAATEKLLDQLALLLASPSYDAREAAASAVRGIGAAAGNERFLHSLLSVLEAESPDGRKAISALLFDLCGDAWRVFNGPHGYLLRSMAQLTADGRVEPVALNPTLPPPET